MANVKMRPALLRLNSPIMQNIVGNTCLALLPGIFTALGALGAGGGRASSTVVAQRTNAILYSIYAVTGFFCGVFLNKIGPRWTLPIGGIGYPIYNGAAFYFDKTGHPWFFYFSGVVLGSSAGWLWSTAAYLALAYSTESNRGFYLGLQNAMIGVGASVGSAIALGISIDKTTGDGVPESVYITFICLQCLAIALGFAFLRHPSQIVRQDGTHLAIFKEHVSAKSEFVETIKNVMDWRVALMLPVMFAAELPLYQASLNAYAFSLRARTLNGFLYSLAQIPLGMMLAPILDNTRFRRRTRGLMGLFVLSIFILGVWLGEIGWMVGKDLDRSKLGPNYDFGDNPAYGGYAFLYFIFGGIYVAYPLMAQWTLTSISNSPQKIARLGGIFKGTVAAGMTVCFGVDSVLPSFWHSLAYVFTLQGVGLLIMLFLVATQVKDTLYFQEEEVIVPVAVVEKEAQIHPDVAAHEAQLHHQLEIDEKAGA